MALATNELFSSAAGRGAEIRLFPTKSKVGTLAAQSGAPLLPKGTPLAYNRSSNLWTVYTQPSATVASYTVTNASGTQTDGGTFELLIDGLGTVHQWDAPVATVQTDINAMLLDAGKSYTIAVTGAAHMGTDAQVTTFTFSEGANSPTVAIDGGGLLDGAVPEPENYLLAVVAAGTDLNGTDEIRGLLMDMEGIQSSAADEVQLVIMQEGEAHRDDLNTAAIRAVLGGAPTEGELDDALRDQKVRGLSLHIRGLSQVS